jgi:hypothetical protein
LYDCDIVNQPIYDTPGGSGVVTTEMFDQEFRVYADYPPLGGMEMVHEHIFTPTQENPYKPWHSNWFYPSPDEYGTIQNAFATWNSFGDSELVTGSTGPDNYGPGIWKGKPDRAEVKDVQGLGIVGVLDDSA